MSKCMRIFRSTLAWGFKRWTVERSRDMSVYILGKI